MRAYKILWYSEMQTDQQIPVNRQLWPGVAAPDKGPIYKLNRTNPWFL